MPDTSQAQSNREIFENEFKTILKTCESAGVLVRLFGSLAFQIRCPQYGYLQNAPYRNINLASYMRHSRNIRDIMTKLGYEENRKIFVLSEAHRAAFYKTAENLRVEIFYEKLDFCHVIHWRDRLEADYPTVPLAELLLEKIQIVHLSEKDMLNVVMLLLEHPVEGITREAINTKLIARICSEDWGLWRTATMNLDKVKAFARAYAALTPEQKSSIETRVNELLLPIHAEPKSLAWKVRDQMGDRIQWYKDVDDI